MPLIIPANSISAGYEVANSLRFNQSSSDYLTRSTGTPNNRDIFTLSCWVKVSTQDVKNEMISFYDNNDYCALKFNGGKIQFIVYDGGNIASLLTNALYRDFSGWYHIVVAVDSTQATESNRIKIYVNGEQITSFSSATYPSQNADIIRTTMTTTGVGSSVDQLGTRTYFDGSMAHVHFIDGTAYNASAFGETDATTGIWKPKTAPSVTYGTNGFFLKFENSGALGTDSSGNGNNLAVNNSPKQTIDTPSNVFATWNPTLAMNSTMTLANGNLAGTTGSTYASSASNSWFSTLGVSQGKYYAEFKLSAVTGGTGGMVGVAYDLSLAQQGSTANAYNIAYLSATGGTAYEMDGVIRYNASNLISSLPTYTTGDIIGVALDLDNHKLYFHKNGTYINSGDPTSGATGTGSVRSLETGQEYFFGCSDGSLSNTYTYQANFGNGYFGTTAVSSAENPDDGIGIFEYDVPTGYKALCTKSINSQEYS